ncbi:hypothetical protein MJT46_005330 [Ovis ammon polii x Ovis aries]|nr:hypothetical protein MJT46_005330 [Ovis ammon polii x Ovis aries]
MDDQRPTHLLLSPSPRFLPRMLPWQVCCVRCLAMCFVGMITMTTGARVPAFRLELISQACCSGDSYMEWDTGAESQSPADKAMYLKTEQDSHTKAHDMPKNKKQFFICSSSSLMNANVIYYVTIFNFTVKKCSVFIRLAGSDTTVEITTSFANSEYFEQLGNDILLEGLDYTSGCGLEGLDFNGGNKEVILIIDKIQMLLEGEQN